MKDFAEVLESYMIAEEFFGIGKRKQKKRQEEANKLYKAIGKYEPMLKSMFNTYANQCKVAIHKVWPEVAKSVELKYDTNIITSHATEGGKYHVKFTYGLFYVDFELVDLICQEEGTDWDELPSEKKNIADKLVKIPLKVPSELKGASIKVESNPDEYIGIDLTIEMDVEPL